MLGTLGLAYVGAKQTQEAEEAFAKLLELAPNNSKALAVLSSLRTKGDLNAAIALVKEQILKASDAPGHYMLLGELYVRNKQPENALEAFAKAQELAPTNPQPYIIRARVMHSIGKTSEAINEFQGLLQSQPNSIPANLGIATLYEAQEKFDEARAQYENVLKINPNQPVAANNLAYLTAQEEGADLGEALRLAMLAKQALPDDARIADTLGLVHYKRKSYTLAAAQFQQALSTQPDDPIINYHLALAQVAKEDKEGALASLQKSLSSKAPFAERAEAEKLLEQLQ
jgi:Flp pilus assembly protein TadD